MRRIFCPKELPAGESRVASGGAPTLPPALVARGALRLGTLGLLAAGTMVVFSFAGRFLLSEVAPGVTLPSLALLAEIGAVVVSLGMFALTRRPGADPAEVLDRGLVYQVLMGFLMATTYHALPWAPGMYARGWTPVAVWLIAFPLMVPSTRGKTVIATWATALMDPLGLLVNVAAGIVPAPGAYFAAQLFLPTAASAVISLVGSHVVHQLSVDAGKAREMGSYRLVSLIGRGGMGEVWRAEHRMLARPAAIKLIRSDGAGGREGLARFEREAQATATLRSTHTVQLYDFGLTEDGSFYSVMELLDGFPLDDLVDQWGPVPPARAVHVLLGVCRSLREAHALGLVHRDIKPGNIFLCRSGTDVDHVKVLDFGLVKETARMDISLTQTGFITGTPGFMAPEMALGKKEIDGRADLYSLACVGFYLLTGDTVFEKRTPIEVIMDHAKTPPPRPSSKANVEIPEDLEDLLMDCLAKDPNERPESARELERRLWGLHLRDIWTPDMAERWWADHASALRPALVGEGGHDPRPRTPAAATHLTARS